MATYPDKEFQSIYDSIRGSMGDDDELRANIEAALRPMYQQSREQLDAQRRANNAAIDVDAYSRGMGNSTWVTDAKLQQLKANTSALASLDANYNNQLFSAILDAQQQRDADAYQQALTFWQYDQAKKTGSGGIDGSGTKSMTGYFDGSQWWPSREAYEQHLTGQYDSAVGVARTTVGDVAERIRSALGMRPGGGTIPTRETGLAGRIRTVAMDR